MQTYAINLVLGLLTKIITEEMVLKVLALLLDYLEDLAKKTENDIDDTVLVPVLNVVRSALNLTITATDIVE